MKIILHELFHILEFPVRNHNDPAWKIKEEDLAKAYARYMLPFLKAANTYPLFYDLQ